MGVGINKRGKGGWNTMDSYFPPKGIHSHIRIPPHDPSLLLCPNFQTPVFTIEQFKFKHRNWEGGHLTAGQSDKGHPLPLESKLAWVPSIENRELRARPLHSPNEWPWRGGFPTSRHRSTAKPTSQKAQHTVFLVCSYEWGMIRQETAREFKCQQNREDRTSKRSSKYKFQKI